MTARPPAQGEHGIPKGTTPTWEMELLISGATLFGLLQIPRELDGMLFRLLTRMDFPFGAFMVWLFARALVLTVAATFLLHLVLRAIWVAEVGLYSIYPDGIRWDRLGMGPHLRAVTPQQPMAAKIEAADNRASLVFGVGVGLAVLVALTLVVSIPFLAVDVASGLVGRVRMTAAFWGLEALATVMTGLWLLDLKLGDRIPGESRPGRLLRRVFRIQNRLGLGYDSNPLIALFASHGRVGRLVAMVATLWVVMAVAGMIPLLTESGVLSLPGVAGLPDERSDVPDNVDPGLYGATRSAGPSPLPLPFIPDRVVKGPYVELFIPVGPRRAGRLREECPEAVAVAEAGGPSHGALDCLSRLLAIQIDGRRVEVPLDASTDPASGARGVLAMIPAGDLTPGRHEITIQPARKPRPGREPPRPIRIPFWR